ncbi:MAG TPA: SpoIIE family protein phosphatase [Acidobacteriaceae bacterium]
MINVPKFRAVGARVLHPGTKLGRITLWAGALSLLLLALRWITGAGPGSKLQAWSTLIALVFVFCGLILIFRWAPSRLLWRLRNRLGVAYIFIGVIPIVLLLLMATIAGYVFAGQFATYITTSDLQAKLQRLEAANDVLAVHFSMLQRSGKLDAHTAGELVMDPAEDFQQRTVTVWQDDKGFTLNTSGAVLNAHPDKIPAGIRGDFNGFVADRDTLHLRAVKHYDEGGRRLTVISNLPLTPERLHSTASHLGLVSIIAPHLKGDLEIPAPEGILSAWQNITAGSIPPPSNRLDLTLRFYTLFHVVDWGTGKTQSGAIGIATRPSKLYAILFAALGNKMMIMRNGLLALAIFFGLIELVALFIALQLSRSITRSVAKLYSATEYVNRGDLTHRIKIRNRDQMASLEQSFNSMTESLVDLVAEQKEKQRLESELAIAREVQDLLFPHTFTALPSLEVYGCCQPARSVSGDYYDFISLGDDRLVLAVGDISGKGISAALLMATTHAFVRAYSLEPDIVSTPEPKFGAFYDGDPRMYYRGGEAVQSQLSPGMLMTTLNYQLFRCTPPEKYATMFLGCYDAATRKLKYCNAGHLPPIILRADGTVCHLETSGTVVGLFDGATYDESTITMQPGDIFIAFSDGVTEPENESGEFGEQQLVELLQQHRDQPLPRIGEIITSSVQEWVGNTELPDDLTIILARAV